MSYKLVILVKRSDYEGKVCRSMFADIKFKLYAAITAKPFKVGYELIVYDKLTVKKPKEGYRIETLSNTDGLKVIYPELNIPVIILGAKVPVKCYEMPYTTVLPYHPYYGSPEENNPVTNIVDKFFTNGEFDISRSWLALGNQITTINPKITFSEPGLLECMKTIHNLGYRNKRTGLDTLVQMYQDLSVKTTPKDRKELEDAIVTLVNIINPNPKIKINDKLVVNLLEAIYANNIEGKIGLHNSMLGFIMAAITLGDVVKDYKDATKSGIIKTVSLTDLDRNKICNMPRFNGYAYEYVEVLRGVFPIVFRVLEDNDIVPKGVIYTYNPPAKDDLVYYVSTKKLDVIKLLKAKDIVVLY